MYNFIEHLFLDTGFPVNASMLIFIAIIIYWCFRGA